MRFNIPITITKGGAAPTPVRLERRRFDEESPYGVGVVMSDGSFKFLRYLYDGVYYALYDWDDLNALTVNWFASGSQFACLDEYIYSEYEDAVEWADVLLESSNDYVFDNNFYFTFLKLTVSSVTFVYAMVSHGDTQEEMSIPYSDWHILTDSLPTVTTITEGNNTALGFEKDGLLFLAHDNDAGAVKVLNERLVLYLENCDLFAYEDTNVSYSDNGAVNINGAFDACSFDQQQGVYVNTSGLLAFKLMGVDYIVSFPIEVNTVPLSNMTVALAD